MCPQPTAQASRCAQRRRPAGGVLPWFAGVAELVDALDLGSERRKPWGFESLRPHQCSRPRGTVLTVPATGHGAPAAAIKADEMQVTETSSSGLKRELKVVVGQSELSERFTSRLDEVKDQVQLKGFRKGKVPVAHIKKLYGRSVMAEVVQQAVEETSRKAVQDRNERPAHQPNIDFTEDKEEIEKVLSGQGDLAFTMKFEILPSITVTDLTALKLEREVADVADEAVDKAVADLVERSIKHEPEAERAAGKGDRLTIDFVGRIDGVEFEGGKGEDVQLVVGEGQFIPGFVEGLEGAKAGEERIVNVKFPDDYPGKEVAGKDAEFTVNVKEVAKPVRPEVNDEFAKTLGAQSLDNLKELVRSRIAGEYASVARMKLKRQALDALDKAHDFALPETLVDRRVRGHLEAVHPLAASRRARPSPTPASRRRSCGPSTARSPSGACGSAS